LRRRASGSWVGDGGSDGSGVGDGGAVGRLVGVGLTGRGLGVEMDGGGVPLTPQAASPAAIEPAARPRRSVRREIGGGIGIGPTIAEPTAAPSRPTADPVDVRPCQPRDQWQVHAREARAYRIGIANGPPDRETIVRRRVDPPAGCRAAAEPATLPARWSFVEPPGPVVRRTPGSLDSCRLRRIPPEDGHVARRNGLLGSGGRCPYGPIVRLRPDAAHRYSGRGRVST